MTSGRAAEAPASGARLRAGRAAARPSVLAPGVEQAAVDVEHDRLVVGKDLGTVVLDEAPVGHRDQPHDPQVHLLLVELQQQRARSSPTATAAATGSARVATNVTSSAILPVCCVFHTSTCPGTAATRRRRRSARRPASASGPARPRLDSSSRIPSIQSPAKIDAHLLRAPAAMFKRRRVLTDPPTGVPWKKPGGQVRDALPDEVAVGRWRGCRRGSAPTPRPLLPGPRSRRWRTPRSPVRR